MKGMVDSFNVSVAAGILMHHAVCDRTSRMVGILLRAILLFDKHKKIAFLFFWLNDARFIV